MVDPFLSPADLHDRVRGALLGTAIGDALGAPFEGDPVVDFDAFAAWADAEDLLRWTDDTCMTIGVAESLVACGGFDGTHMASCFVANHDAEPWRGYGAGPPIVLDRLRVGADWRHAAAVLFAGCGSFGNGAAMGVASVGLLMGRDIAEVARTARDTARINHADELGQDGAAIHACAVAWLVTAPPTPHWLTALGLLEELRAVVRSDGLRRKLREVERLLPRASLDEAIRILGNGVAADDAVPAAVFAFLRHIDSFADAVTQAVCLGGDTDTIGAMTGALSGAFHGVHAIPEHWRARLEARQRIEALADDLFAIGAKPRSRA